MNPLYLSIGAIGMRLSTALGLSLAFTAGASGASLAETARVQHMTEVKSVCSDMFRFRPMETEYRACIDSLAQSLADADRTRLAGQEPQACAAESPRRCGAGNK